MTEEKRKEKNGGENLHRPTEETKGVVLNPLSQVIEEEKIKKVENMTMDELKEMLTGIDKDLKYVRNLSVELNKQRDNLHRYIKIRRRKR